MVKLLIADDEPLVCAGLRSMLKWEDLGIEIIGTARNGKQAAELIESQRPEIVITDIKMPIKTGLELAEECSKKYGKVPLFIILTSFEEFEFARRAISIQAVDYLIKLELSAETLSASIEKALSALELLRQAELPAKLSADAPERGAGRGTMRDLREKFFLRLYNNLFESSEQYAAQKEDLGVEFPGPFSVAAVGRITAGEGKTGEDEKLLSLYAGSIEMIREMLEKKHSCYITVLDTHFFTATFSLNDDKTLRAELEADIRKTISIVYDYFNVDVSMAFGKIVDDPLRLDESYLSARRLFREIPGTPSKGEALLFFEKAQDEDGDFSFTRVREDIRRAFEELDTEALREVIAGINTHFQNRPDLRLQAMDAACNMLYMAISLLPGGEEMVTRIFAAENGGYREIYRMNSVEAICAWLSKLGDGCCEILQSRRQNYKQQMIAGVQEYIRHNLGKRLSLHDVAAVFNFSPNYLSQLFTKYGGKGFVEYITGERIDAAREMLARRDGPVYEIAEKLGFESAFYFSKVFKKVTGLSPREFQRNLDKGK
jgi:two-component system response regulator YesN